LFQRALEATVAAVASAPMLGAISAGADVELRDVRRVLMRRTRYHV
jgi:hypothetical protein